MALTAASNLYTRENIVSMLKALSFEDKRWTLDYLINLLVVPPKADDSLMSKAEFYQQIETAIEDARAGRTFAMKPDESLDDFMLRMEAEGNV